MRHSLHHPRGTFQLGAFAPLIAERRESCPVVLRRRATRVFANRYAQRGSASPRRKVAENSFRARMRVGQAKTADSPAPRSQAWIRGGIGGLATTCSQGAWSIAKMVGSAP